MSDKLGHCWEILKCGRENGGNKVGELGECPASKEDLGHSCWIIAGTFCEGVVQGTVAHKSASCMLCEVYKRYNRLFGLEAKEIVKMHPDEEAKYNIINENLKHLFEYKDDKNDT